MARPACGVVAAALVAMVAVWGCNTAEQRYKPASPAVMEEAASARSNVIGMPAPDFALNDQDGQPVSLSSLHGKWVVLYFYPRDDTPGCTCEANEFTALLTHFGDMNAVVYGVSADSPRNHRAFIDHYGLKIGLLSDPDHKVMERYGAWVTSKLGDQSYGRVIRTTFLIGPDGMIRHHWPEVIPQGHAERVRAKLAELQQQS